MPHSAGRVSNTRLTSPITPKLIAYLATRAPRKVAITGPVRLLHQYRGGLVNIAPQEPAHQIHFVDALEAWLRSVEDLSECH